MAKGWGKGGKWQWVQYRPELTEEEIAERRKLNAERHAERVEKEERKVLDDDILLEGTIVQRAKWHAWIQPKDPSAIPEDLRQKLSDMNKTFREKATDNRSFCGGLEADVIYLAVADIKEQGLVLRPGLSVKFQLYEDLKGVGACAVVSAEEGLGEKTE